MWAEFKHTVRRLRGQIIGWSIGIGIYVLLLVGFYDSIAQMQNIQDYLKNYPREFLAFFGDIAVINTPAGYLDTYFYTYMTMIAGIFSISAAVSLLAGDEEKGHLDLVLAQPVSRTKLFWGRQLGLAAATALILVFSWLCWVVPAGSTTIPLTWLQFLKPYLPLFAELMLFSALATLLSLLLPAGRLASWLTGMVLVGNFLLLGLANLNSDLKRFYKWTPLHFYQGGRAVDGINWGWLGGLLAAALLLAALAWLLFQRRDIRVGGERGWGLPKIAWKMPSRGAKK